MSIHLLNQPDPEAPIDAERLGAEFQHGLETYMDVPLSITHLASLALAAQRTVYQADCSGPVRAVLLDFLGWCSQHAEFGVETRKLLAQQAEFHRMRGMMDSNGAQTSGQAPRQMKTVHIPPHETLESQPQEQAPAPGALCPAGPVETTNPS